MWFSSYLTLNLFHLWSNHCKEVEVIILNSLRWLDFMLHEIPKYRWHTKNQVKQNYKTQAKKYPNQLLAGQILLKPFFFSWSYNSLKGTLTCSLWGTTPQDRCAITPQGNNDSHSFLSLIISYFLLFKRTLLSSNNLFSSPLKPYSKQSTLHKTFTYKGKTISSLGDTCAWLLRYF